MLTEQTSNVSLEEMQDIFGGSNSQKDQTETMDSVHPAAKDTKMDSPR